MRPGLRKQDRASLIGAYARATRRPGTAVPMGEAEA